MKILFTFLVFVLAVFQYRLWLGSGGMTDVHHLKQQRQQQIEENKALKERNDSLAAEVVDLKQGMEAIEERARSEMGMIKNNESFYRLIENPTGSNTAQP